MKKLMVLRVVVAVMFAGLFAVSRAKADDPPPYLLQWGSQGSSDGQFINPYGVTIDGTGKVYVVDSGNWRVQKFTSTGTYITQWNTSFAPSGIACDEATNIYIVDSENHRIQKFTNTGTYLMQWGTPGTGNGQFDQPRGVACDGAGNVYVADSQNHRIQKFTSTGIYLAKWGTLGNANGLLNSPSGVAVDSDDNVYVADSFNNRIQKFTSTGIYLAQWSTYGIDDGQYDIPTSLVADGADNVYVTITNGHRIKRFTSTGNYITQWATAGSGNGQFYYPIGVACDSINNVYVADTGNHRILKFGSVTAHTITATAGAGGTINPSGSVPVLEGGSKQFQMTPDDGYIVDNVTVDGNSVGTPSTYTFTNVTADHLINATFEPEYPFGILSAVFDDVHYTTNDEASLTVTVRSYSANGQATVTPTLQPRFGTPTILPSQQMMLVAGTDSSRMFTWTVPTPTGQSIIDVSISVDAGAFGQRTADFSDATVVNQLTQQNIQDVQQEITECGTTAQEACEQNPIDIATSIIPFLGEYQFAQTMADDACLVVYYESQGRPIQSGLMWLVSSIDIIGTAIDALDPLGIIHNGLSVFSLIPSAVRGAAICWVQLVDQLQGNQPQYAELGTKARLSTLTEIVGWPDSLQLAVQDAGDTLADLATCSGLANIRVEADSMFTTADSTGLGGTVVLRMSNSQCVAIRPQASKLFGENDNPNSAARIKLIADTAGTNTFVLFHRQASGDVVKLEYAPFALDSGGVATVAVAQDSTTFPLLVDQNGDGIVDFYHYPGGSIVSVPEQGSVATALFLAPAMPNPSTGQTLVRFSLPHASAASLVMFDLLGRKVKEWRWTKLEAGPHSVRWDGKDDDGRTLPPGVLFYRLSVGNQHLKQKLIHLR